MARIVPSAFPHPTTDLPQTGTQTAILAGGCFWCTEAVFERLPGVSDVLSGYMGGDERLANYDAVCSGRSGHAEAIAITYDASVLSYGELLRVFSRSRMMRRRSIARATIAARSIARRFSGRAMKSGPSRRRTSSSWTTRASMTSRS